MYLTFVDQFNLSSSVSHHFRVIFSIFLKCVGTQNQMRIIRVTLKIDFSVSRWSIISTAAATGLNHVSQSCLLSVHRCREWTGWLQHAGLASCSLLFSASLCCPRVVEEGPGAPLGAPPPAAPQQGVTGEEAPTVGPALASGWRGGRPLCGWQLRLRQGQPWR